jgi:hypothetical protein
MFQSILYKYALPFALLALQATACFAAYPELTPVEQAKVEKYKVLLAYWATQRVVIEAAIAANKMPFYMSNSSWDRLADNDPIVAKMGASKVSLQLKDWEADRNIIKLNLRDLNGNLVAFSTRSGKPILFNNKMRAPFIKGLVGPWSANEIKPDPSTQLNSVQIAAPVMDGSKVVGVLHSAVQIQ